MLENKESVFNINISGQYSETIQMSKRDSFLNYNL